MSGRKDIEPNERGWKRLSYTTRCGWVDWGHALPTAAQNLKRDINREYSSPLLQNVEVQLNGEDAFILEYGFAMGSFGVRVSNRRHWVIKKGLTQQEKERVALGIYLETSVNFERLQGSFPYNLVSSGSSFSAEDLISNLIGFYSAYSGQPQDAMRRLCGEVSVDESYRIWDQHLPNGLDGLKNTTLTPIFFPSNEGDSHNSEGLPPFLTRIRTEEDGRLWVKPNNRFVDGRIISRKIPIKVDSTGSVSILNRVTHHR